MNMEEFNKSLTETVTDFEHIDEEIMARVRQEAEGLVLWENEEGEIP